MGELKLKGYPGAYTTLTEGLKHYGIEIGKKKGRIIVPHLSDVFWRPSKTTMLFFTDEEKLSQQQHDLLKKLCLKSTKLALARSLTKRFRNMMKEKHAEGLSNWIKSAIDSGIKEIAGFAKGLQGDLKAVKNALSLPWSNGPVEGNVNKLKTYKRQMYGRASFDLLKKRLVLAPT